MYSAKGAGQRILQDFHAGKMHFIPQNYAFGNKNEQEFFLTSHNRIIRFDKNSNQYNAYNEKLCEFVPCSGLHKDESVEPISDQSDLFQRLLSTQQTWKDYLCERGGKFGQAAAKQAVYGASVGLTMSAVGPLVGSLIEGLEKPVSQEVERHVAHHASLPNIPRIPESPGFPEIPIHFPELPTIHFPFFWHMPVVQRGGAVLVGSGIGFVLGGGPLGAIAGSAIGAGLSSLF